VRRIGFGDAVLLVQNQGTVSFVDSGHGQCVLYENITGTVTEVNTGETITSATHFTSTLNSKTATSQNVGLIYHFANGSDVFIAAGRLIWGSDGTPSFAAGQNMPYDSNWQTICSQF
jgi:hypothetical protein